MKAAQKPKTRPQTIKHFKIVVGPHKKLFIKHLPSGQTMFNNVDPKVAETCIKYLNNVKIKWVGNVEVPTGFVSALRGAFEAAYKCHGFQTSVSGGTIPEETPEESAIKATQAALALLTPTANKGDKIIISDTTYIFNGNETWDIPKSGRAIKRRKKEDKPKRNIKRREKNDTPKSGEKPQRTIKRREKPTANKDKFDNYGFTKGDYRSFIVKQLADGAKLKTIIRRTRKKFAYDESTVNTKIQMVLRLLRKRGIPIAIIMYKSKDEDYYQLKK